MTLDLYSPFANDIKMISSCVSVESDLCSRSCKVTTLIQVFQINNLVGL